MMNKYLQQLRQNHRRILCRPNVILMIRFVYAVPRSSYVNMHMEDVHFCVESFIIIIIVGYIQLLCSYVCGQFYCKLDQRPINYYSNNCTYQSYYLQVYHKRLLLSNKMHLSIQTEFKNENSLVGINVFITYFFPDTVGTYSTTINTCVQ